MRDTLGWRILRVLIWTILFFVLLWAVEFAVRAGMGYHP